MPPRKKKNQLGKSLIRTRFQGQNRPKDDDTNLVMVQSSDGPSSLKLQSITQENDLDAFIRNAEISGADFTAERMNVQVISASTGGISGVKVGKSSTNPFLLSKDEEEKMITKMKENQHKLVIPKRPNWTRTMSAAEVKKNENEAFLDWRRGLAYLEEEKGMIMTPFERNIEVWRQLWRVIERSDVVVQIVDARNPLMYRSADLEDYVKQVDPKKRNLLLVNKADFLTKEQRIQWAEYFKSQRLKFIFFSAAQAAESMLQQDLSTDADSLTSQLDQASMTDNNTAIYSCEQLYALFESFNEREAQEIENDSRQLVTIGLVGYPNVGKSSTINALIGAKKVNVSSTPGKTKHFQTLNLSPKVQLCDCPGLVMPSFASTKAEMVVNGVLPIDQLREYTGPVDLVCQRIPKYYLEYIYGIKLPEKQQSDGIENGSKSLEEYPSARELLEAYALMRGFRKSGQGLPDESRAARIILKDYVNGKLLFCAPPPSTEISEPVNALGFVGNIVNFSEAKKFNEAHYLPGGQKFAEAEIARKKLAKSKNSDTNRMNQALEFDKEFISDGKGISKNLKNHNSKKNIHTTSNEAQEQVKAKTSGKFKQKLPSQSFSRVNLFPHQSGYVMSSQYGRVANASELGEGPLNADAISSASILSSSWQSSVGGASSINISQSKKHHKHGKKRVKDRSWRA